MCVLPWEASGVFFSEESAEVIVAELTIREGPNLKLSCMNLLIEKWTGVVGVLFEIRVARDEGMARKAGSKP